MNRRRKRYYGPLDGIETVREIRRREVHLIPAGASEQPVVLLVEKIPVNSRLARAMPAYMLPGAVTVATEQHIDVLLMDLHIPGVAGFEAARRIRRYQTDTGARRNAIIALSADVRSEERERCLAAGMNAALGKPIDETELRSTLKELLEFGGFAVSEEQGARRRLPGRRRGSRGQVRIGLRRTVPRRRDATIVERQPNGVQDIAPHDQRGYSM